MIAYAQCPPTKNVLCPSQKIPCPPQPSSSKKLLLATKDVPSSVDWQCNRGGSAAGIWPATFGGDKRTKEHFGEGAAVHSGSVATCVWPGLKVASETSLASRESCQSSTQDSTQAARPTNDSNVHNTSYQHYSICSIIVYSWGDVCAVWM